LPKQSLSLRGNLVRMSAFYPEPTPGTSITLDLIHYRLVAPLNRKTVAAGAMRDVKRSLRLVPRRGDRNTYPGRRCPENPFRRAARSDRPTIPRAPRRSISTIPRAPVNIPTVLRRAKRSTHIHPAPRRYSKCHPGRRSTSPDRMHTAEDRGNLIGWCACSALRGIALISPRFGKARRGLPAGTRNSATPMTRRR
jgi:hypothetical protein